MQRRERKVRERVNKESLPLCKTSTEDKGEPKETTTRAGKTKREKACCLDDQSITVSGVRARDIFVFFGVDDDFFAFIDEEWDLDDCS